MNEKIIVTDYCGGCPKCGHTGRGHRSGPADVTVSPAGRQRRPGSR